jgi:hypothetical protein
VREVPVVSREFIMTVLPPVERAGDAAGAALEDVRVDHRRGNVLVTEKFLNGSDIRAGFQQMSGE